MNDSTSIATPIKFRVDTAESIRRGVNVPQPGSDFILEIDIESLSSDERSAIASRCSESGVICDRVIMWGYGNEMSVRGYPITAPAANLDGVIEAIRVQDAKIAEELREHSLMVAKNEADKLAAERAKAVREKIASMPDSELASLNIL